MYKIQLNYKFDNFNLEPYVIITCGENSGTTKIGIPNNP